MSEPGREKLGEPMSDQMAWDMIYELALTVAQEHGAVIPDTARFVGPYAFTQAVEATGIGLAINWEGRMV